MELTWEKDNERKIIAGTHNGVFHADEVFAIALLKIFVSTNIEVIRSRNPEDWKQADILMDVGAKLDGEIKFDHHHKKFEKELKELGFDDFEVKPSSAGLILKKLEKEEVISSKMFEFLYSKIIKGIDGIDNGVKGYQSTIYNISDVIRAFNPHWANPTWDDKLVDERNTFNLALQFAIEVLKREVDLFKTQ